LDWDAFWMKFIENEVSTQFQPSRSFMLCHLWLHLTEGGVQFST
jgi:hypothetical protein